MTTKNTALNSAVGNSPPRLNPFIFPADTDFRFALLIVSVVGASLFIYYWLYTTFFKTEMEQIFKQCHTMAKPALNVANLMAYLQALSMCFESLEQRQFVWSSGGVVLLLLVAGVIYWMIPALKIRRGNLVRLNPKDMPDLAAYVVDLCQEAGLPRRPTFLLDPLNPTCSGLAFGRLGQYYVLLPAGLVIQFYNNQPLFRAIVLHELAHLRHADVDKTYFSVAIWQAFQLVALLPFTASLVYALISSNADLGFIFNLTWRVLALAGLVYLMRNGVLRARELYADVRASTWAETRPGLEEALATLSGSIDRSWQIMLQVHPQPDERRQALTEPHRLFRLTFWDAVSTGIAAAIALPILEFFLTLGLPLDYTYLARFGAALLFVPLALGVVGTGAWRNVFAARVRGETTGHIGVLGIGLGLGVILGLILSFEAVLWPIFAPTGWLGWIILVAVILLGAVLLPGSLFCLLHWVAAGASTWLEAATTLRALHLTYRLGVVITGGLVAVWLALLFFVLFLGTSWQLAPLETMGGVASVQAAGQPIASTGTMGLTIAITLFFSLIFISLWAFPLSAWFWHKQTAPLTLSSWAFLDPLPKPLTLPPQPPLNLGLALKIGLIGSLVFCGLLLVIHLVWGGFIPEATRSLTSAKITFFGVQVALAILIQAGVAVLTAGWIRRVGAIHALFAAFVAGCVMTVAVLGLNLLFGGKAEPIWVWSNFCLVVNGGALAALPTAISVSALVSWFRRS